MPDALAAQILDSVGFFDIEATPLEISKKRNQAVALIPVRVPRAAQILVEGELLYPGVVLAHRIDQAATLDYIGEDCILEHHPTRGVLFCRLAPSYVGA